jgi:protocatechuate 3,4-dioxygenase beta subunit
MNRSMRRVAHVVTAIIGLTAGVAHAGEIRGRILAGETPAGGVRVAAVPYEAPEAEARRQARGGEAPKPLAATSTQADGTFTLAVAAEAPAAFRVLVEGGGIGPSWLGGTYDASESDDLGEHDLPRAQGLAGRVTNATGAAVAGAQVTLLHGGARGGDGEVAPASRTVTTAADGSFRFDEAAAEGNRLTVEAGGYGAAGLAGVRAGTSRPIVLGPAVSVSGIVVRADRRTPVAGALVRFESESVTTRWVEAGTDGGFQLADLPPKPGMVVVEGGDAGIGEASTGGAAPKPARLTIVVSPPPTLSGRAVDAKTRAPVPRTRITVDDGTRTRLTRSGPDGSYVVRGLVPQRRYRLRADEPRYTPFVRDEVLLATAESKRVDIPLLLAASLSGRVVDDDGKPVAGALGRLAAAGGSTPIIARLRQIRAGQRLVFRTAADGTFKATRLTPGEDQRLTVVHPDFEPHTTGGVSLAPGSTKTGLTIVLHRGLTLSGFVRDEAGRPLAEAQVELAPARGFGGRFAGGFGGGFGGGPDGPGPARARALELGGARRERASTSANGGFEMKGLAEGEYVLSASKQGFATQSVEPVRVAAEARSPVEVTLARGASIRGTLTRADGTAAEGYWVRAVSPDTRGRPPFGPGELRTTGAGGAFSIDGLRAGESYDLVVLGRNGLGTRREDVMAPADGLEVVLPGPGRITGRVLDSATLAPVADFQVDFEPDRSTGRGGFGPGGGGGRVLARVAGALTGTGSTRDRQAVHSEDGSFVLDDVPPGTWEVVAQAEGYQTAHVGGITIDEGGTREGVELRLTRGSSIRGRVLDAGSGTPVLDASVTLVAPPGGAGLGGRAGAAALALLTGDGDSRSDADGRFVIDGLAPGTYTVMARHPDYADGSALVEVKEGPAAVDLRLTPGGGIGGVVLSEANAPLPGAAVTLSSGAPAAGGFGRGGFAGGQSTVTDDGGRFRFSHLAAGRYTVQASLRGHQAPPVDLILQAGETRENLTLSLASGARIRGIVSGLPSAEQAGVVVAANGPGGYAASTRASADGAFELTGAPAGLINLRATAAEPGGSTRSATAQTAVAEGQEQVQVEIVFDIGFALAGTVTRNGQPVDGAMVMAALQGGGGRNASARTNASGGYRLEGLAQGAYDVTVVPPGGGRPQRQTVVVADDTTLDVPIPTARLTGAVLEAGSRQPLADASVQVAAKDTSAPFGRGATSDSNGRFSLDDLDFIAYVLTVRKQGFEFQTREVTPTDGGEDVVFELVRGDAIAIEVRDLAFGVPIHAAQVRAVDAQGAVAFANNLALDSDGRGQIPSLKAGGYAVAIYAAGYAPALLTASVPAPRITIGLAPGGTLEIHAGPTTLATGTARAQIVTADGQPYPFAFFASDGRLSLSTPVRRIENLAAGRYVLQVAGGEPRAFDIQQRAVTVLALP